MQPAERIQAERRIQAWKGFLEGSKHTTQLLQPIDDIALLVKYIDYLKNHSRHNTLHTPSLIVGAVLGGTIVLTAFLIFG